MRVFRQLISLGSSKDRHIEVNEVVEEAWADGPAAPVEVVIRNDNEAELMAGVAVGSGSQSHGGSSGAKSPVNDSICSSNFRSSQRVPDEQASRSTPPGVQHSDSRGSSTPCSILVNATVRNRYDNESDSELRSPVWSSVLDTMHIGDDVESSHRARMLCSSIGTAQWGYSGHLSQACASVGARADASPDASTAASTGDKSDANTNSHSPAWVQVTAGPPCALAPRNRLVVTLLKKELEHDPCLDTIVEYAQCLHSAEKVVLFSFNEVSVTGVRKAALHYS